ncbi:hypothetical protein SNL152K_8444 [Streptomyces sp. NL15-2K]|nr:hypothetical protein SNL152K_8444 [Streptomyces sp. NL15-2K]
MRLPRGQPAQPAQRCSSMLAPRYCPAYARPRVRRRRDRVRGPGPPPPILPRPASYPAAGPSGGRGGEEPRRVIPSVPPRS